MKRNVEFDAGGLAYCLDWMVRILGTCTRGRYRAAARELSVRVRDTGAYCDERRFGRAQLRLVARHDLLSGIETCAGDRKRLAGFACVWIKGAEQRRVEPTDTPSIYVTEPKRSVGTYRDCIRERRASRPGA